MKTADLRKYRKNQEALEAVERLLSSRIVADSVQGSRGAPEFSLTTRKIANFSQDKETESLLKTRHELNREQAQIRTFISGIKERRIYQALYYYCISDELRNPTWEIVAETMHEDSPQALRMSVERHLKKYFANFTICS